MLYALHAVIRPLVELCVEPAGLCGRCTGVAVPLRVVPSRAAPGKSGLHARGEGERVLALESREGTRASRRVEEGLLRSLSGGGG